MLNGVEFVSDREKRTPCPDFVKYLCQRSLELGLNLIPAKAPGLSAIRLAPPLTATQEEIASGLDILAQAPGEAPAATLRPGRAWPDMSAARGAHPPEWPHGSRVANPGCHPTTDRALRTVQGK